MLSTDQFRDDVPNYFITDDDEMDELEDSLFDLFDNDDFDDIGDIGADFYFDRGLWSTSPYPEKPTPALTNGQLQSVPGLTALRTKASTDYAARALRLVVDKR
ncbi:hypothetical protein ACLOJK_023261 [Asimina triloba]